PESDQDRRDDHVARGAEVGLLVDDDGGDLAIDAEAKRECAGAGRSELGREVDGVAYGGRGHRGEAEKSVRRDAHLEAEVKAERGFSRERARPGDELLQHGDRQTRFRLGEKLIVEVELGKELLVRDVPALHELSEMQRVNRRDAMGNWSGEGSG